MRFLHTSDWHLNALRTRFPDKYLVRHHYTLSKIINIANKYEVDAIVVAGDIWDRPDLTNTERTFFAKWLQKIDIPIIFISGNHDLRVGHSIGNTALNYLSALPLQTNCIIRDGTPDFLKIKDTLFVLVPYFGWASFDFKLVVESVIEKASFELSSDFDHVIVVAHECVTGSVTDSGFKLNKANKTFKVPDLSSVTYWAFGDIHKFQRIGDNAFYCGSPHQVDFGENENKGVLLVDTNNPSDPEFIPIIHTMPLVTWSTIPENITNFPVFLRIKPTENLEITTKIPDNVIYEPPHKDHIVYVVNQEDPLSYLPEFLSNEGLNENLVAMSVEIANDMIKELR